MFANAPGDLGSIPGRVIPKTQKMVLYASLLNAQHYKVWIKGKVVQSRERSIALPLHLGVVAIGKEPSGHPRLGSPILLLLIYGIMYSYLILIIIFGITHFYLILMIYTLLYMVSCIPV